MSDMVVVISECSPRIHLGPHGHSQGENDVDIITDEVGFNSYYRKDIVLASVVFRVDCYL